MRTRSTTRWPRHALLLAVCLAAACAGSDGPATSNGPFPGRDGGQPSADRGFTEAGLPMPAPDGAPPTGLEAGSSASQPCSAQGGGERAVVVAAGNNDDISQGGVALLQINANGLLTDTQLRLGPIAQPRAVALSPDSQEAAIAYGSSSSDGTKPHGVVFVALAPSGTQASIAETTVLPGNAGPLYLGYTTKDSLIVSRIGPAVDQLVPITRQAGGQHTVGTPYDVPDGMPQEVVGVPRSENEALLLSAPLGHASLVRRVGDAGGTIRPLGSTLLSFDDRPFSIYMHPSLNVAYVPGIDGAASSTNPNPPGKLRVIAAGSDGEWALDPTAFAVPSYAGRAAVSPTGELIVFADEVTGSGQAELYAVQLDGDGRPLAMVHSFATFPASMIFDVAVTREGHIVVSRQQSPSGNDYDVISFARVSPTAWLQCPTSVGFRGAPELRIARLP